MYLSALACGLLWVWFMLLPSTTGGFASRLAADVPQFRAPDSARFQVTGNVQAGPVQAGVRGEGAFAQPDRFRISLEAEGQRVEQIVVGETMYFRTPNDPGWQVINLGEASRPGQSVSRTGHAAVPAEAQAAVDEVLRSFTLVGVEMIDGSSTRRYHADIDLLKLAGELASDPRARDMIGSFGLGLDLWIGESDGYLRQLKLALDIRSSGQRGPAPDRVTGDVTVSIFDLNRPVSIVPPVGAPPVVGPAQVPGQLPVRAPAQLPRAGSEPAEAGLPLLAGLALTLCGVGVRVRDRQRQR